MKKGRSLGICQIQAVILEPIYKKRRDERQLAGRCADNSCVQGKEAMSAAPSI
jgi:hypothetical protein